jgi:Uma2 family endonuclease
MQAHRERSYADLEAATMPDGPTPELIDGQLCWKASPRASHAYVQGTLREELRAASRSNGGRWWILIEPDVIFAEDTVLRPDLAGWRIERLPELPDGPVRVEPDWVCEILSPGHERYDRITKLERYARYGVPFAWIASPELRTVEAYRLQDGLWVRLGAWTDGNVLAIPPFEGLEVVVGRLFVPPAVHEP